jgi:dTMP kinase
LARGAFITLEGIEGVGKSTALATIEAQLKAASLEVKLSREPGGTVLGERIREWVLHGDHGSLSGEVEALLMFAAREHHLQEVIVPALTSGQWVVCDRFNDATMAYQGGGRRANPQLLRSLSDAVQGERGPDLTLLLDAPTEVGFARIGHREHDHFEREQLDFFERVREAYLAIAASDPERVKIIDADRELDAVQAQINAVLERFMADFGAAHV